MSPSSSLPAEPVYAPASFLSRIGSTVIDMILIIVISVVLSPVIALLFALWPVAIALTIFYVALFDSSSFQGTPGKIALGMRVTDSEGRRISLRHAVWRAVCHYLILLPPLAVAVAVIAVMYVVFGQTARTSDAAGMATVALVLAVLVVGILGAYLMVIWTRDKQTAADWLAGTLVVKPRVSEAQRAATAVKIVR